MQERIAELSEVKVTDIRYTEVEYGVRFGVKYDAVQLRTPSLLLLFERLSDDAALHKQALDAAAKLEARAASIAERDSLDLAAATAKARRIHPDLAESADTNIRFDLGGTGRALAQLVTWIGLRSRGELIEPTEGFFLNREMEFHAALIAAIMEDFNRPSTASTADLPSSSTQKESTETCRSDIDASALPNGQAVTGESSITT